MSHDRAGASRPALLMIWAALRFIPRAGRDRYRREWAAELEEMRRQDVPQVAPAARILLGAPSLGRALRASGQRWGLGERLSTAASYDAFMAYSRGSDDGLAALLQRDLNRFATPWYRRGLRVFRDPPVLVGTDRRGAPEVALACASRVAGVSPF